MEYHDFTSKLIDSELPTNRELATLLYTAALGRIDPPWATRSAVSVLLVTFRQTYQLPDRAFCNAREYNGE
jgi:hypothetical protein